MKYTKRKLNLPVSKYPGPPTKKLSMEKYLEFVNFCLKYTIKKTNRRKNFPVNIPFSIK